jgi:TRAP-type mannitol/chloroaromatic compound transport system permease large subunit
VRAGDPAARTVSHELVGFILLGVFFVAIFAGFPIAFTLMFLSLAFGYLALGDMVFYLVVFQTIGLMKEEVLAAVPLFIFMGYLLEEGGLMERLFHALRLLLGPVPGSLYVAVLVTATIFGIAAGPWARRSRSSESWRRRPCSERATARGFRPAPSPLGAASAS